MSKKKGEETNEKKERKRWKNERKAFLKQNSKIEYIKAFMFTKTMHSNMA